jgi:hypothetical protein
MNTTNPNYPFINRHLIGIIRDIADESGELAMPILQEALAKLRVKVDGLSTGTAAHWVDVTTESISLFSGGK